MRRVVPPGARRRWVMWRRSAVGPYSPLGSAMAAKRGRPSGERRRPTGRLMRLRTKVVLPDPTRPSTTMLGEVMTPWS